LSKALDDWAHRQGVKLMFSRPGDADRQSLHRGM